ncbi:transglycosylase domain-containing protein [Candidatus Fermentibacteria bacterium]|nr:transglycosylase domain-containing protein [Candidatus Fermentibacteria bacterium]
MARLRAARPSFIAAVAAAAAILVASALIVPGLLAERVLERIDPSAAVGRVEPAPGAAMLESVRMPRYGFEAPVVWVLWDGTGRIRPGRIVVPECSVRNPALSRCGTDSGRTADPEPIPMIFLDRVHFSYAGDSSEASLVLGGESPGGLRVTGTASGRWGGASFRARESAGEWAVAMAFDSCSGLPGGVLDIPRRLRGHRFGGTMEGLIGAGGGIRLSGSLDLLDGREVRIPFTLVGGAGGGAAVEAVMDISESGGLLSGALRGIDSTSFLDISPEGRIVLSADGGRACGFRVEAAAESTRIYSRYLSEDTVIVSLSASLCGSASESGLSVDSGTVSAGPLVIHVCGSIGPDPLSRIELRAWNDCIEASALSDGIPEALQGCLAGTRLSGTLGIDVRLVIDPALPESSDLSIDVDDSDLRVEYCPVGMGRFRSGGACTVRDSWGNTRRIVLDPALNDSLLRLDSLPPWFEDMLCCAEDGSFRSHSGFSAEHIRGSLIADVSEGRFVRGGSTITMQLARNLFLGREKTLARKLQEVFLTWMLERTLDKDRILEIYINIVELGPDVFGFAEASRHYFGVEAGDLSPRRTAYLISLLPGPRLYYRFFERGEVPDYWESGLDVLLRAAARRGGLDRTLLDEALAETVSLRR